jgi:hypothetical protein
MLLHARPVRVVSTLMLIAVVNVYVFANGAMTSQTVFGKLVTTSNRPILVNGGEAITGTTILSGTQLITPAAGGAIVELNNIGNVMVAPNSNVALTFDNTNLIVRVTSGNASVSTVKGVTGSVLDKTGAPVVPSSAPPAMSNGEKWGIAGVAVGGAAFIWAIIAWNRANDARDSADAANAAAASLAAQLAALRTCLAGQTTSPLKLCTSF